MSSQSYDVVGIGAPFIDYIIDVSDEFLQQLAGDKGGMIAVDYPAFRKIIEDSGVTPKVIPGGSGANTIRGLAWLGHSCALIGKIGDDEAGKLFLESLTALNVVPFLIQVKTPTAQAICLITPEGERTMRSFLGAGQEISVDDLNPRFFNGVQLVHIEGYTLLKEALTQRTMELGKAAGAKISFDLGSFEVVKKHKDDIVDLLTRYVDVLFANRDEVYMLTQLGPEKGCQVLADICETVVVLLGAEGCLVARGAEQVHIPAYTVEAIDTTGAGDLFASGFLHGYLKGRSLSDCGRYGVLTGAAAVQVRGVEITPDTWQEIRAKIQSFHI